MATVTTPSGDVLEGVSGTELDYYRGEANTGLNYTITEDDVERAATFPQVFEDGVRVDLPAAPVEQLPNGDLVDESQVPSEPSQVEQLPEGQAFQSDGAEHVSDGTFPLPEASGHVVDTATGLPVEQV